jgi:hypothetical protein
VIEITRYSKLKQSVRDELDRIIKGEFGHIPIVSEITWATPDWTVILYKDGEIATFCNIIERTVMIDNRNFLASGINNLITPEKFRGQGFATHILKETENFIFENLKSELGILLCADELVPFYERLKWYKVNCPVWFNQPTGAQLWKANTMLRTKEIVIRPDHIDLGGLPW